MHWTPELAHHIRRQMDTVEPLAARIFHAPIQGIVGTLRGVPEDATEVSPEIQAQAELYLGRFAAIFRETWSDFDASTSAVWSHLKTAFVESGEPFEEQLWALPEPKPDFARNVRRDPSAAAR